MAERRASLSISQGQEGRHRASTRSTYGKGLADETKKIMSALGSSGSAVRRHPTPVSCDFSALVSKIKRRRRPRLSGRRRAHRGRQHPRQMRAARRQRRHDGRRRQPRHSMEFAALGGPGHQQGYTTDVWPRSAGSGPRRRKFPEENSRTPQLQARGPTRFYSYAAVQVLARRRRRPNSLDPQKVAEEIKIRARCSRPSSATCRSTRRVTSRHRLRDVHVEEAASTDALPTKRTGGIGTLRVWLCRDRALAVVPRWASRALLPRRR